MYYMLLHGCFREGQVEASRKDFVNPRFRISGEGSFVNGHVGGIVSERASPVNKGRRGLDEKRGRRNFLRPLLFVVALLALGVSSLREAARLYMSMWSMPPMPAPMGMAPGASGMSVISDSVVRIMLAIEAAFSRARAGDLHRVDDAALEHVAVDAVHGVVAALRVAGSS